MSWPIRSSGAAILLALLVLGAGFGWSRIRFGADDAAAKERLETDVRGRVADRSSTLEALAREVAAEQSLIVQAIPTGATDSLGRLFERLAAAAASVTGDPVGVSVYVPGGGEPFRVLAWSDGPAGMVAPDRLNGPAALFVAPGTAAPGSAAPGTPGIRLVYVHPIDEGGRRVAVVETETVLSRADAEGVPTLPTTFGPVAILPYYAGAGAIRQTEGFVISTAAGAALIEVHFDAAAVARARARFHAQVLRTAALPFAFLLVLAAGRALDRRRRAHTLQGWLAWSVWAAALAVGSIGIVAMWARGFSAPPPVMAGLWAAASLAVAALVPGSLACRRVGRRSPGTHTAGFVVEQMAAGAALAAATTGVGVWLARHISAGSLAAWQSALFPLVALDLVGIWSVLLVVLAIVWAVVGALAAVTLRWRVALPHRWSWIAAALWLAPLAVLLGTAERMAGIPRVPTVILAVAISTAALCAARLRRYFRHTTQAMRLFLGLLALLAPLLAVYPLIASISERTTRAAIEHDYGPATAGQADQLRQAISRTRQEIDALEALPAQVRDAFAQSPVDSQLAFSVWRETSLSRTRVISDIELYGRNRTLVSRFAMNFPEYVGRTAAETWMGEGCDWQVSGEVTRFGSIDRPMLHATRGLCLNDGQFVGAVVIHVAPNDYQALPFLSAANPYSDVFDAEARAATRPPDLQLVVYGWSLRPLFLSGRVAWPLDNEQASRLYREGTPFWTRLEADGRRFNVYLLQNRAGIYALGYPAVTLFEHAARLAEIAAVTAVLFVLAQIGALVLAPIARRRTAPLRILIHEVRTSFYRKLFLFFVLVAVGPVFMFGLVFGAYMTSKFRSDVEAQASGVVTVARRVFEQIASADDRPSAAALAPTDDLMVWIRQVIGQDVNLFEGANLRATSQRDLYNSGLLPTRTPAIVYRRIALDRLPWFVTEDQQALVAASPVSSSDQNRVLSVPLVSRQREIEDEMDDLGRGVLVGSVLIVLLSAALGASLASRVSDPVARLTKATRQIAAGRLDVRIATDTADELRRLVDDFNTMTARLVAQRAELARANQLKAWNEMARQVAHEIKNPLTPIQLATEHLQRVHDDRGRPLGESFDQCVRTILSQVRLLRQIASEFANFAGEPVSRPEPVDLAELVETVVGPYRLGLSGKVAVQVSRPPGLPYVRVDRTLVVRALTNLIENAVQAMPMGGNLDISLETAGQGVRLVVRDTGIGMDASARQRAFEPYFSTKTAGSGLGLANAKRNIEREGGTIALDSAPGQGTIITVTLPSALPHDAPGSA